MKTRVILTGKPFAAFVPDSCGGVLIRSSESERSFMANAISISWVVLTTIGPICDYARIKFSSNLRSQLLVTENPVRLILLELIR
jgi:hypothetical protein